MKACVAAAGNKINVQAKIVDVVDRAGMATTLQDIDKKTPVDLVIANAGIGYALRGRVFIHMHMYCCCDASSSLSLLLTCLPHVVNIHV